MNNQVKAFSHSAYTLRGVILLAVLALLASACRASAQRPGATDAPSASAGPAGAETQALTELDFPLGPGEFNLGDPLVGLADLSSYTATLTQTFDGIVSGEAEQWTDTYVMMRDNAGGISQLTITAAGDATDSAFYAEVGQNAYAITGEGGCLAEAVSSEVSSIKRADPAGRLFVLLGAEEAGQEEINGVPALHYTFDELALGKAGLEDSTGEIWVAADGGFILRYTLTTIGGANAFGEGIEGTLTWDYALTDINSTVLPALPEGCQLNVPVMADAADVLHTGYWLAYTTASSLADAAAFYQAQLPGFGWTLLTGPLAGDGSTFMEFTQGEQTIGVMIIIVETGTQVNIVLYDSEE